MARILIIDDTKNIRKMVELTVQNAGHQTQTAEDGEAGLQVFDNGANWDLTIVDQQMPKLEGRGFVEAARKRDPGARIIMMTAFATADLASEVMQLGALDFLRKPFSTEVLRGAVEAALSHSTQNSLEIAPPILGETSPEISPETQISAPTFSLPRVSYRFNGFSFWPLSAPPAATSSTRSAAGLAHGVAFQVRDPNGNMSECFVGVTAHIQQQIERDFPEKSQDADFWETLCGLSLMEWFWDKTENPPAVLPVYEVPKKLREMPRSPVSWGFFTRGR